MNITCKQCGEDVVSNGRGSWTHDDEGQFHDPTPVVTEWEAEQAYDDLLDEVYGTVEIAGIECDTSRALRELDPVAYQYGLIDWLYAEGLDTV